MMHVNIVQTLRKIGTIFSFVGGSLKPAKMKLCFSSEQNVAKCFGLMIMWNVRLKFIMDCSRQCLKMNCHASMIFYVRIVLNSSVCSFCHKTTIKREANRSPGSVIVSPSSVLDWGSLKQLSWKSVEGLNYRTQGRRPLVSYAFKFLGWVQFRNISEVNGY